MAEKIPQKINKALKDYIDVLKKEIPIQKVVLYGSWARGQGKTGSDIDIAIISEKFGKNPQEEGKYLMRKLWEIDYSNIEPIGYSPEDFETQNPSPLLAEIKKYGKEVRV